MMTNKHCDDPNTINKDKRSSQDKNQHAIGAKVLIDMVQAAIEDSNPEAIKNGLIPLSG